MTFFFAMQVLQSLELAFKVYIGSLNKRSKHPSTHISTGLALCSLTKRANAFLGGLLAVEYFVDLINISCGTFFLTRYSIDIVGEGGVFRYQMFMMAVNNGLFAFLGSARILILQVKI